MQKRIRLYTFLYFDKNGKRDTFYISLKLVVNKKENKCPLIDRIIELCPSVVINGEKAREYDFRCNNETNKD